MGASNNSDFFVAGFCSCKACIHAILGNKCKQSGVPEALRGAYVQDVLYADFAGA